MPLALLIQLLGDSIVKGLQVYNAIRANYVATGGTAPTVEELLAQANSSLDATEAKIDQELLDFPEGS